jgi:hypothetical protein
MAISDPKSDSCKVSLSFGVLVLGGGGGERTTNAKKKPGPTLIPCARNIFWLFY